MATRSWPQLGGMDVRSEKAADVTWPPAPSVQDVKHKLLRMLLLACIWAVVAPLSSLMAFGAMTLLLSTVLMPIHIPPQYRHHYHLQDGYFGMLLEIVLIVVFLCACAFFSWRLLFLRIRNSQNCMVELKELKEAQR